MLDGVLFILLFIFFSFDRLLVPVLDKAALTSLPFVSPTEMLERFTSMFRECPLCLS